MKQGALGGAFRRTLVRTSGEMAMAWKLRARKSTMGVFPLPPQVRLPTLTTGTGRSAWRRRGRSGEWTERRRRTEAAERSGRRSARWRKGRSGTAASGVTARRARSCRAFSVAISSPSPSPSPEATVTEEEEAG